MKCLDEKMCLLKANRMIVSTRFGHRKWQNLTKVFKISRFSKYEHYVKKDVLLCFFFCHQDTKGEQLRRRLYTTVLGQSYSPCGKYLATGNNFGDVAVFRLDIKVFIIFKFFIDLFR